MDYFTKFAEKYGPLLLRAKPASIVRDMMSYYSLHGLSASTYRWYMHVGKVTLRQFCVLDFVKEVKEGFPSSQYLGVTTMDYVMLMEFGEETALLLVRSSHLFFNHHNNPVVYAQLFNQSALALLNQR